jgi:hypothetical protein
MRPISRPAPLMQLMNDLDMAMTSLDPAAV